MIAEPKSLYPVVVGNAPAAAHSAPPLLEGPAWCSIHRRNAEAHIWIGHEIGVFGRPSESVLDELSGVEKIGLTINSTGGDCLAALKLFDGFAGRVDEATITGSCFSSAVILALSAKKIRIEATAKMMVHSARRFVFGNAEELANIIPFLRENNSRIMDILTARCGESSRSWFDGNNHYFSADEAIAAGLADEILHVPEQNTDCEADKPILAAANANTQTDDEGLFLDFLRAFGSIKVHDRVRFERSVKAFLSQKIIND